MGRRREPAYDLQELQRLIGQGPFSSSITLVAEQGAVSLGWQIEHVIEAVLSLERQDFYKSMEAERIRGLWQDVYRLEYRGLQLYIKLQMGTDGRAVVVQFKAK